MFWAFQDVLKYQEKSAFKDWYDIKAFDNPATPENEFAYQGWVGVADLPDLKKVNVQGTRVAGLPYEGDINAGAKKHIMAVTARWLAPDGNPARGIDGYRLDVAEQVGMQFWRDFRREVRRVKPDAYLAGEIWWEAWPDRMMNPAPYTGGDIFDAVMFYQAYRPARYFFANTQHAINARQLADSLQFQWSRLRPEAQYAMMNVNASHDAPRLLTCFGNPGKYKFHANVNEDPQYNAGMPNADTYRRVRLYLVHQFTSVGAPHIWNGDEMGMWGADDPDCRKPLWWKEFQFEPETKLPVVAGSVMKQPVGFNASHFAWYKKVIAMRKAHPALIYGDLKFDEASGQRLAYTRTYGNEVINVLINAGQEKQSFDLDWAGTDLLTGKPVQAGQISLGGFSAVVLQKEQ
jgi:glycosidase